MPKGQAPRISDKSLKKKYKTKAGFLLDKSRSDGHENKNTLQHGMNPKEWTLRKTYKKNSYPPKAEYVKSKTKKGK